MPEAKKETEGRVDESRRKMLMLTATLAVTAGYTAFHFKRVSLVLLVGVVLAYQFVGTLGEWLMKGNFYLAVQDFRIGIPGMLLQVFGGYLFINRLIRK